MNDQSTHTVFMVRPFFFRMNEQTAVNNYYQVSISPDFTHELRQLALSEFDEFVRALEARDIKVCVYQDDGVKDTPDSIFPNNWISTTNTGEIVIYPMFAPNRRAERKKEILDYFNLNFHVGQIINLSESENHNAFLEGTGSLVLDRTEKVAYCAISERSSPELFKQWCNRFGYRPVAFSATQWVEEERKPIYHTNVMMSIGTDWVVCCFDALRNPIERSLLRDNLSTRKIIEISEEQCESFCGNVLELMSSKGKKYIVMSKTAFDAFNSEQKRLFEASGELIVVNLKNIETYGGGSARCMLAEVFLTLKS